MLSIFYYFYFFIIGCCIGSFLNVIVYRLPNDLSIIKPRSFCPTCKTKLSWSENIPLISWALQKGRCKNCLTTISLKYPLVELFTGILFVLFINSSPYLYNSDPNFFSTVVLSWIFLSLLICITLIDIKFFWIPQGLINIGFISGVFGLAFLNISSDKFIDLFFLFKGLTSSLISFFIFEVFRYFAKYIFKRDAIGKGDSKLVAMIALWLGPIGTLFAVAISYIFAAIYCLVAMSAKLLKFRQVIPFAPFLSVGALFVWLLGNDFVFEKILRI